MLSDFAAWLGRDAASTSYEIDAQKFGTFGDFVGGLLNPFLTFATFAALLFTVLLQQRELSLARTEFKRTANALEHENFEATFFRLSSLVRETADAITIEEGRHGVQAFRYFYERVRTYYRNEKMPTHKNAQAAYQEAYNQYGYILGHYFRVLYNSFRYLSTKKATNAIRLKDDQDRDDVGVDIDGYAKLLRAQLSDYELAVLLYNTTSVQGRNLRAYLEEFEILDNLPRKYLLNPDGEQLIGAKAWGSKNEP